jgi:tripartite-type tricarboxylate transporter receptor subunit TctC
MEFPRRTLLRLAASVAAVSAIPRIASALDYPARTVRIIAGYPPGLAPDIIARLFGQWLSEQLGQQFVTENRPGAASNIGTELVAKAPPDGYTLLIAVSTNAINATLYPNLNFNFVHDLVPVASIGRTPFMIVVNPAFPAKILPEFIAYVKANPGKINFASAGVGTGPHVSAELFKMMTGADLVHVPYRGSYMSDLLGGQIPLAFAPIAQVIEFVKDGRLRALAVTSATRSNTLPDVPAIGEFVPGYVANGWYGICAPAGTPEEIIDKLNATITAGVTDPKMKGRLFDLGVEPKAQTPVEFGKFVADEIEKWAKVIRFSGMKPA